jgi:hypothetical protein
MADILDELEKHAKLLKYIDFRRCEEHFDKTFGDTKYAQLTENYDQLAEGQDAIQYPEIQPPEEFGTPPDLQTMLANAGPPMDQNIIEPQPTTAEDLGNFAIPTNMPEIKQPSAPKLTDTNTVGV